MKNILYLLLKYFFGVTETNSRDIGQPRKILVIRQHNQLGDLLACISVFRALKEKFPSANVSVIVSPANKTALHKVNLLMNFLCLIKVKLFHLCT